jgi:hypothetical protein
MPIRISYNESDVDDVKRLLSRFGVSGTMKILSDVFHEYASSTLGDFGPTLANRWKHLGQKFIILAGNVDDPMNS